MTSSTTRAERTLRLLQTRRSKRVFTDEPVSREVLERLITAAASAPSATNRQPWRFAVVTDASTRRSIVDAVANRTEALRDVIRRSHHGGEFDSYGDFFVEPLASAAAIVVPQFRVYPDTIGHLIRSGGGKPGDFHTPAEMQPEVCGTSAACMLLLVQAHAEGLGACWMAGPTVARDEVSHLLSIRPPWTMMGAIAIGHPSGEPKSKPPRKDLDRVTTWWEEEPQHE